jgi:hypothetical protein
MESREADKPARRRNCSRRDEARRIARSCLGKTPKRDQFVSVTFSASRSLTRIGDPTPERPASGLPDSGESPCGKAFEMSLASAALQIGLRQID